MTLRSVLTMMMCCSALLQPSVGFSTHQRPRRQLIRLLQPLHLRDNCANNNDINKNRLPSTSRYEDSDVASKGLVSSLTAFVNSFSTKTYNKEPLENVEESSSALAQQQQPPASPQELLERIRRDYTVKNYLWTGDIDLTAFDELCQFTDPTLSFTGTAQFVSNLQNLRPLVDALTGNNPDDCQSTLLDITLQDSDDYVETRWNMVGELSALPWKPKIDVIGRTKFWYRKTPQASEETTGDSSYRVVFYDEEWEIPAAKALLQLVTPAGTIRNSSRAAVEQR